MASGLINVSNLTKGLYQLLVNQHLTECLLHTRQQCVKGLNRHCLCNSHISLLRCRQCTKPLQLKNTGTEQINLLPGSNSWQSQGLFGASLTLETLQVKLHVIVVENYFVLYYPYVKQLFFYNYNIIDILMYHIKNMVFEIANIGFFLKIMNIIQNSVTL